MNFDVGDKKQSEVENKSRFLSLSKQLSDQKLWDLTKEKAQQERNLALEVIDLLREVRSRRLHLKRGYSSFHQYCVQELKYDDGEAHRKIKTLELTTQVPETIKSLEEGSLTLTTASQIQNFFETQSKNNKSYSKIEKLELVSKLENQSKRQIEKTLATIAPEVIQATEKLRYVSETNLKLELIIDEKLYKKLERLRELTSHKNKSFKDVIESLVDEAISKKDPLLKQTKNYGSKSSSLEKSSLQEKAFPEKLDGLKKTANSKSQESEIKETGELEETQSPRSKQIQSEKSRYILVSIKNQVWVKANSQCTYIDPITKNRCSSKNYLQIEHIKPFSQGGLTELSNLTLLCTNHNRLAAIETFGKEKMEKYLKIPLSN